MKAKVIFIACILRIFQSFGQTAGNTNRLFELVDTLPVDSTMVISPGQLSKNGNTFYFGFSNSIESETDQIYSDLYTIDMTIPESGPQPLHMPNPDNRKQFFQCSATADERTLVYVVNEGGGWNGNELAIAQRSASGAFEQIRKLSEINDTTLSDAYPWLSADGKRIYFTRNFKLMRTEQLPGKNLYANPVEIDFTGDVQLEIISCWLTIDELTMFFIANSRIYTANRKSMSDPFSFPELYTDEFRDLYFIAGLSFSPDKQTMIIYYFDEFNDYLLRYRLKKGKAW